MKEEIINCIKKLEDKIKDLNDQEKKDLYKFASKCSTRKSMTEEWDEIAEVIDDNVKINKVGSIETKVTNDNISEDSD